MVYVHSMLLFSSRTSYSAVPIICKRIVRISPEEEFSYGKYSDLIRTRKVGLGMTDLLLRRRGEGEGVLPARLYPSDDTFSLTHLLSSSTLFGCAFQTFFLNPSTFYLVNFYLLMLEGNFK